MKRDASSEEFGRVSQSTPFETEKLNNLNKATTKPNYRIEGSFGGGFVSVFLLV